MSDGRLELGKRRDDHGSVELPVDALLRHVMALGSSGSGKTVFCKAVVEECLRNDLPAICVDPQGDLCSLVTPGDPAVVADHGVDPSLVTELHERVDPVIFTPASRKGVALCADPVERGMELLDPGERTQAFSRTAAMVVNLLGYDPDGDDGAGLSAVLDTVLGDLANAGRPAQNLSALADHLARLDDKELGQLGRYLDTKKLKTACQRLARLDVGARRLLFHEGLPIDIDLLLGRAPGSEPPPGKVRLGIIYLNTLHSQDDKDFFVAALASRLYGYMLKNPSREPQALFYLDEVAPFIPPVRKPAAKDPLVLLFKQARKYGVCCLMATQNPGDVDYKAMAQFGTWALGRTTTRQDLKKLAPTVKSLAPTTGDAVLDALPSLKPGQFVVLSPDHFPAPCPLDVRWLLTRHETYDEERISEVTEDMRGRFAQLEAEPESSSAEAKGEIRPEPESAPPPAEDGEAAPSGGGARAKDDSSTARSVAGPPPAPAGPSEGSRGGGRPVTRTAPLPAVPDQRASRTEPMPVPPTVAMPVSPPPAALPPTTPPAPTPPPDASSAATPPSPAQTDRVAPPAPVLTSSAPTPPAPLAAAAAAAIDEPPRDPEHIELEKQARTLARRRAMSVQDFARAAGIGERKARHVLKQLVESDLAKSYKEGRRAMYFAVASGARPDLGLTGKVLVVTPHVDERGARHIADSHARGKLLGLIGKDETFERAEPIYRLVYKLDFEERVERPVFGGLLGTRQDQLLGSIYVHPRSFQLLVYAPHVGIYFADRPAENASDVADFDGVATFSERLPGELPLEENDYTQRRSASDAKRAIEKRYAVTPGQVNPLFVPLWRLILRAGRGTAYRVVHIDALTGRPVDWP